MAVGFYLTFRNYPPQPIILPLFQNAEQFIKECQTLLIRILPHQINENASLTQSIFQNLYAGRFDDHLELLIPLIQTLAIKGANFGEMVVLNPGPHSWDLACHRTTFLHYKDLVEKQHPNTQTAWRIFEPLV